jgi:hypothetical protein
VQKRQIVGVRRRDADGSGQIRRLHDPENQPKTQGSIMKERKVTSGAVVDFDFDETGKIIKNAVERPKVEAEGRTLDEIRQRVLAMGARQQQRSRLLSMV